jgi:hypothetical protein
MRRRIVEIPRQEVGRFRRESVMRDQKPRLSASLGERAIARQLGRKAHVVIVDDPMKAQL